jgi:hypothetical protein
VQGAAGGTLIVIAALSLVELLDNARNPPSLDGNWKVVGFRTRQSPVITQEKCRFPDELFLIARTQAKET